MLPSHREPSLCWTWLTTSKLTWMYPWWFQTSTTAKWARPYSFRTPRPNKDRPPCSWKRPVLEIWPNSLKGILWTPSLKMMTTSRRRKTRSRWMVTSTLEPTLRWWRTAPTSSASKKIRVMSTVSSWSQTQALDPCVSWVTKNWWVSVKWCSSTMSPSWFYSKVDKFLLWV